MKNKKLIATVASLCLVLVAVVAAVIGVLAAAQQNVSNRFSIKYQANDVNATITAAARVENGSFASLLKQNSSTVESITFGKSDSEQNVVAEEFNQTLSSSVRYVVYKMSFANLNTQHGMKVKGTYTFATTGENVITDTNVSLWYCWTTSDLDATAVPTYAAAPTDTVIAPSVSGETFTAITKPAQATTQTIEINLANSASTNLYIIVAITDTNTDSQYLLGTSTAEGFDSKTGNSLGFVLSRYDA